MKSKKQILLVLLLMLCTIAGSAKKVHTLGDSTMAPYDENATNTRGWGMYFGNRVFNLMYPDSVSLSSRFSFS